MALVLRVPAGPAATCHTARSFGRRQGLRLRIAVQIRRTVASEPTRHSRMRTTAHPARRRPCETRASRRLFDSIFSRQNFLLLRGRYLHEHPCQKHPSTNTATFRRGHAKSGRPVTGHCLRYPRRPAAQRIRLIASSVVRLPFERTEAMIFERMWGGTWSISRLDQESHVSVCAGSVRISTS
jgi:hypothetical protein